VSAPSERGALQRLDAARLDELFSVLHALGYTVVGPTLSDGAIVYDEITSPRDLPQGWSDEQSAGRYRLARRNDAAYFGYVVGPHSFKKYLFPPRQKLCAAAVGGGRLEILDDDSVRPGRYAFLGVRACEITAIAIQDRVFLGGSIADPVYAARRNDALIIAVQCTQAAATCFCTSMGSGPKSTNGFDLGITEVFEVGDHYFVLQSGSDRGEEVLARLGVPSATEVEAVAAMQAEARTLAQIRKTLDTNGLKEQLQAHPEHPHWADVASRCLSCANCTLVCPTCFCTTIEDVTDLTGEHAERWRRMDSCFTNDFSYLHGGSVRTSTAAKYRQWMTHKLSTWWDQFGTSGCVGCGRCITWCPAAIDITEEVKELQWKISNG